MQQTMFGGIIPFYRRLSNQRPFLVGEQRNGALCSDFIHF
jgi:hypothetical protein